MTISEEKNIKPEMVDDITKQSTNPEKPTNPENTNPNYRPSLSGWFIVPVVATFIWLFFGITGIMGFRMFWNSPVHPSFALFGVVAFSVVVAFSIVLTLEFVTGKKISFNIGKLEFTGTSGPVVLWVLVFLSVMSAFILSDITNLVQSDAPPNPSIPDILSNPNILSK